MIPKLINLTPHSITIYNNENKIVVIVPSEGIIARVNEQINEKAITNIQQTNRKEDSFQISIEYIEFNGIENLPIEDICDNKFYIVSSIVKSFCRDRHDVIVPKDFVRDDHGNIIGCRGFYV